jgi:hypothetical protein
LIEEGLDTGAHTVQYHLLAWRRGWAKARCRRCRPSGGPWPGGVSSSLSPKSGPRWSFARICAELPNGCRHRRHHPLAIADGSDVKVLNFLDDHSRYLVAAQAFKAKGLDVVRVFQAAAQLLGLPASLLTDNGAITPR